MLLVVDALLRKSGAGNNTERVDEEGDAMATDSHPILGMGVNLKQQPEA